MADCIFCSIVKNQENCFKIYETDQFLAFLDMVPLCEGHTLVIPKKHYRWVWDVENIGEYYEACQKIARHFQHVTQNELVISYVVGEQVPHAHIHIVPATPGHEKFFTTVNKTKNIPLSCESADVIVKKYRLHE